MLEIIGINHFNPIDRLRLISLLTDLSKSREYNFIALEWDENMFYRIKYQRDRFNILCRNEWPSLSNNIIDILTNSLAYEGDSHIDILPNIHPLWLDNGRINNDDTKITRYPEDRLNIYKSYFNSIDMNQDDNKLINNIDISCRRSQIHSDIPDDRDSIFSQRIIEYLNNNNHHHGIAIVGFNHTLNHDGKFRYVIENNNIKCRIHSIND